MPPSSPGRSSISRRLFITQEEDDEESASLADMLEVLVKAFGDKAFLASAVASVINDRYQREDGQIVRDVLLPGAMAEHVFTSKSVTRLLKKHIDEPVRGGGRTLALRRELDPHTKTYSYRVVVVVPKDGA